MIEQRTYHSENSTHMFSCAITMCYYYCSGLERIFILLIFVLSTFIYIKYKYSYHVYFSPVIGMIYLTNIGQIVQDLLQVWTTLYHVPSSPPLPHVWANLLQSMLFLLHRTRSSGPNCALLSTMLRRARSLLWPRREATITFGEAHQHTVYSTCKWTLRGNRRSRDKSRWGQWRSWERPLRQTTSCCARHLPRVYSVSRSRSCYWAPSRPWSQLHCLGAES